MENKKSNTGLIVTIVVLVMLILFGGTLFVLSSMGYISFGKEDVKEEINDNDKDVNNDDIVENAEDDNALLNKDEALNISKELIKKYFEYYHSLGAYCGGYDNNDYLSFGSYDTNDFRDYNASTKFNSIVLLKEYFATFMIEDLFPNYLNDGVSYLEKDGKLYCQLSHKGPGETYNESKSYYVVNSIEKNKIMLDVILISDVVESNTNTREGIVEISKNIKGDWVISKYDVMISDLD